MATSEKLWALRRVTAQHQPVVFSKPSRTILLTLAFALLPLASHRLQERLTIKGQTYRQLFPHLHEFIAFASHSAPATSLDTSVEDSPEPATTEPLNCIVGTIEDPNHDMDFFDKALARTDEREPFAITRLTHYGDSPITNDGITGTTRRLMQERFGDAGHGFILIDKPWDWYGHQAVTFSPSGDWSNGSLMAPRTKDGLFGLGGVAFFSNGEGQRVRFEPAKSGNTGRSFSRMEVYFLQQPDGGAFKISANDQISQSVSTSGEQRSGFAEIKTSVPARSFEVDTTTGEVRLFGAVLENDGPGVVYDSLGVNGAFAGLLATAMNEHHWSEQLQHRKPDLVILNYGTNESQYASDDQMGRYEKELKLVVQRVRTALPQTSILIISPMDRGQHVAGGKVVTLPAIPKIVEMQRRVAVETHCAFLDMFTLMGGEGTMSRWRDSRAHLVGGDLTHPNAAGAEVVGTLLYAALLENYSNYRERISRQTKPNSQQAKK